MKNLIAFTGPAGAGKSTAAFALSEMGFDVVKFAGPLKAMLRGFYEEAGLPDWEIRRRIEGDLKEVPCPLLGGKSPRYAMQTLGTEWGRNLIDQDLWVNAWSVRVSSELENGNRVTCDDCRFPNEKAAIEALGGSLVGITGRGGIEGSHASERGVTPHETCLNVGDEDELVDAIQRLAMRGDET